MVAAPSRSGWRDTGRAGRPWHAAVNSPRRGTHSRASRRIEYHRAMCRGGVLLAMGIGLIACAGGESSPNYPGPARAKGLAEFPPPSGLPQDVPASDLYCIGSKRDIVPNDAIRNFIADTCELELFGVFRVCIGTQGTVVSAYPLKTTGFGTYDQQIVHSMRLQWHCRPFIRNGVPEPVCTTASIHYRQRAPRRGGCLAPRR